MPGIKTRSDNALLIGFSPALLAFRIYKVNRDLSRIRATVVGSVVYPVMRTAIDAGVLYTILLIAAIVNQLKSSDPWVLPSLVSQLFLHLVSC